jgi:ankyrin repeat protein
MRLLFCKHLLTVKRFRWVACQIDALENCLDPRTLKHALATLPKTLDETYYRILDAIPPEHKLCAIRILQFLTFSARPLTIKEAVDAIAVDTEGDQYFNTEFRMPVPQEIARYCSSLVVIVPTITHWLGPESGHDSDYWVSDYVPYSDGKLQLAHFSVKEYLMSNRLDSVIKRDFRTTTASASIARVCLAYLLHFNQEFPPKEVRVRFPLAQYSARFWMSYAAVAEDEENLLGLIEGLFCLHEAPYKVCYSLHRPDEPWEETPNQAMGRLAAPLYYAAFGGLHKTVKLLLNKNANVNAQGGHYGNALQAASDSGHEAIVRLLVENGVNVNAQGGYYGNALQAASDNGHEAIVRLLVENGANVNAQGGYYGNALQAASDSGHEAIVRLLVENGANVNAQGGHYGNALQAASDSGHEAIVRLLVKNGANVNAQGGYYGNALQAASDSGYEAIVRLLVENGVNVNAQGGHYGNALQAASYRGHKAIVRLLVKNRADVDAQGGYYGIAL